MNKRTNRKAFFILVCIGLMYISTAFNLTERFSMKRVFQGRTAATHKSLNVAIPERPGAIDQPALALTGQGPAIEPSLFMAIPIVSLAIKDGLIEKDGLIFVRRDGSEKTDFKKPMEILKDKDEEGLKSIAEIIGKKQLTHLLKRQGITIKDDLELNDMILGKGYAMEKEAILAIFGSCVNDDFKDLFPFSDSGYEITKNAKGYEMTGAREHAKVGPRDTDVDWIMPVLTNLPMKAALEKISLRTSRVKVYGSGIVMDQSPKPSEKMKGEAQCVLYGRSDK